jgi:uncharacterized protein YqgC (DUF456 family)
MDGMTHAAGLMLLALVCMTGLASLVIGMPGTFVILGASIVYAWLTEFQQVTWSTIGWLGGLSLLGETLEFLSAAGATGGERPSGRTAASAVVGGFIGGLMGAPILFGLGALFGALAGAFSGATFASYLQIGDLTRATRVGLAAMRGRFLGFIVKLAIAVTMIVLLFAAAI